MAGLAGWSQAQAGLAAVADAVDRPGAAWVCVDLQAAVESQWAWVLPFARGWSRLCIQRWLQDQAR